MTKRQRAALLAAFDGRSVAEVEKVMGVPPLPRYTLTNAKGRHLSGKQLKIKTMFAEGKSRSEISQLLGISICNLNSTIFQMRKKGTLPEKHKCILSPRQLQVLTLYAQNKTAVETANILGISWQTVEAYANEGFRLLDLTTPGIDRIALLRVKLLEIAMDDPAFN